MNIKDINVTYKTKLKKEMKKLFYSFLTALLAAGSWSCSKEDDVKPDPNPSPDNFYSYGVFVVNNGAMYSNIPGSLGYFEYESEKYYEDVFAEANNGQTIGDIFNAGYIYDDYIYLAVTNSAVLHVINRKDFKIVKTISTNPNAGPRQITSYNGKIYMTLFGQPGYVAEVNPSTLEITKEVEVGPLPEYIVPFNGELYVSVSDGYSYDGANAAVVVLDPETLTVKRRLTGIPNPVNLATDGHRLYVCSCGLYMQEFPYSQSDYGIYEITENGFSDKIVEATNMTMGDQRIYYVCDAYTYGVEPNITYGVLDTRTNTSSKFIDAENGVDSPTGLGVDPKTGNVFILSYAKDSNGVLDFNGNGYMKEYRNDGSVIGKYTVGISPSNVFFNVEK